MSSRSGRRHVNSAAARTPSSAPEPRRAIRPALGCATREAAPKACGVQALADQLPGDHACDAEDVADGPKVTGPRPLRVDGGHGDGRREKARGSAADQDLALEHEAA